MKVKPKSITLNKQKGFLEITWMDDHVCQYPLSHLREACPCVECRGGHQFMGLEFAPDDILKLTPARSYEVMELNPIGHYAIQPVWDDGHSTGIYSWEYLRLICPEQQPTDESANT